MSCSHSRIEKLRAKLTEADVDAFYIRDTSNIYWLTVFDDVFDSDPAHSLFLSQSKAVLHTDSRYAEACEQAAAGTEIVIDTSVQSHSSFVSVQLQELSESHAADMQSDVSEKLVLGIEGSMALSEYRQLEKEISNLDTPVAMEETNTFVLGLRAVKDSEEIKRMKSAQAITDAAFKHISQFVKPGMTEREVQLELENYMLCKGAQGLAFSSIVATGAHGASPHAIPGDTELEAGHAVVLDFGAIAQGYCSDMTRMLFLGEPSQRFADAYVAIREANEQVEALLKPGVTGAEAHQLAEDILIQHGFGGCMGHSLGHGVGIDVHESPNLAIRNRRPLVEGNVVTVEPGIYVCGEFGMRLEDFGVVTANGFEVFTQSGHEMVVV